MFPSRTTAVDLRRIVPSDNTLVEAIGRTNKTDDSVVEEREVEARPGSLTDSIVQLARVEDADDVVESARPGLPGWWKVVGGEGVYVRLEETSIS